jgi:hypothetical protein
MDTLIVYAKDIDIDNDTARPYEVKSGHTFSYSARAFLVRLLIVSLPFLCRTWDINEQWCKLNDLVSMVLED